jgi:hypothetical protein
MNFEFYHFLSDRINRIYWIFFVSAFPDERQKSQSACGGESDILSLYLLSMSTEIDSLFYSCWGKATKFCLFLFSAFQNGRQKTRNPDYPVNPV